DGSLHSSAGERDGRAAFFTPKPGIDLFAGRNVTGVNALICHVPAAAPPPRGRAPFTHTPTHTDTQIHTHTHTHTRIHTLTQTRTHTHTQTRKHTRTHARTHSRTHTRTHSHTRMHTHIAVTTHHTTENPPR